MSTPPRTSPDCERFAGGDLPGLQASGDRDDHVAVVVIHRLGLAGFEGQVPERSDHPLASLIHLQAALR